MSQLGMLILINIAFGFAVTGIDNAAHLGGLVAGLWLGAVLPPTRVQTMASLWQRPGEARTNHLATVPTGVVVLAFGVVALAVVLGLVVGGAARG
jgi:rhomboid protease GluP